MKVAPETGQSIRAAADCGRVATRGARRGARRSKAHPPCQRPEAVCPRHKDRGVVRTNRTKSHTSSHCHGRQSRLMQKYWERHMGYWSIPLVRSKKYLSHPLIPIDMVIYDIVMTLPLLFENTAMSPRL